MVVLTVQGVSPSQSRGYLEEVLGRGKRPRSHVRGWGYLETSGNRQVGEDMAGEGGGTPTF